MCDEVKQKTYGPLELLDVHHQPAPGDFAQRRRIAAAMRVLSERLIRIEASEPELTEWANRLESLVEEVGFPERRDTRSANRKLFTGQATACDIFDMMDYDPVGGGSNPVAPQLQWEKEAPDGVVGSVCLGLQFQGPPGRVHGGVISLLMDAVLSRAMHAAFKLGVTGTLSVRYMDATPIEQPLKCTAHIVRTEGRKMFIEGAIEHQGKQTVHAEGIFFQPDFSAGKRHK